jgi:hypothetical protein
MKSLIISIALVILTTTGFAQFPQSTSPDSCCFVSKDLRAAIIANNNSFVDVKIAKLPGKVVKIRVKDENEVLYLKRVKSHEIVDLKYDISQFPEGTYTFEILQKNEVVYAKTIEHNPENRNLAQR